ncbi:E3 ubiquitin ligase PARAQUAT TOLERANCE 3-like isoform X2 [Lolium rigidum]|uniref:E3 ubiquitin ligase PARAQUAT TOLERANCE 3-like isoform X2 n=1 Tax=Lolium rigidum TaxID=89674 RepID=UPI001F5E2437|nr:E3 ubiquitin ligase PARAQUAT TOLERANCE 3-like isoform X2 [Lolium rigidum]
MGVVYYKYKSAKETYSVPLPYSFISVSELKQLILSSNRHGNGRTRGRGPREDIALSNAQTGEEYADDNAMIPQNVTVLVRRVAGQMSENIVVFSSRKVIEDGSIASNKSVVTESVSKSCSSTEVQDEDAAIAAVIDAAEVKWEDPPFKRGQHVGRFPGRQYGHGPLDKEAPPPGYVCRSCGVPGHFIQHCPRENQTPPPGYTCYRCRIPGHFIHHCPTIGDPKFDDYKDKMSRSFAPVVPVNPVDGILYALAAPAASASVVDDLPAELHCRLCNKVMADAVLTSKCCFDSFCDKCIRDYIITQSKCICGVKVLADDLIPNHTLRSTISNMLGTRACSTASGTGKHKSSSGSNPDPKLQSPTTSAASGKDLKKQCMDQLLPSASPDAGVVQVAREDDHVDQQKTKTEGSAGGSVQTAVPIADPLKLNDVSESTLKGSTISGTLEPKVAKTDQLKKKRKKADSTKVARPNNADYGYNVPFDPAYCNPFNGGYPMVTDPYMYNSMGMPYGGYPMDPFGVNPFGNMPLQAPFGNMPFGNMPQQAPFGNMPPQALNMQGYPANYQSRETHPAHGEAAARSRQASHRDTEAAARSRQASHRDTEAAVRSRQTERPEDTGSRPRPSERSRSRSRSRSERREHGRSDRASEGRDHGRSDRASVDTRSERRDHGRSDRASIDTRSERRDDGRSDRASNDTRSERREHGRSDRASNDYDEDNHSRKRMRASSPADDKQSRRRSRHSSRSLAPRDDSSDDEQNFKRTWGRR